MVFEFTIDTSYQRQQHAIYGICDLRVKFSGRTGPSLANTFSGALEVDLTGACFWAMTCRQLLLEHVEHPLRTAAGRGTPVWIFAGRLLAARRNRPHAGA